MSIPRDISSTVSTVDGLAPVLNLTVRWVEGPEENESASEDVLISMTKAVDVEESLEKRQRRRHEI